MPLASARAGNVIGGGDFAENRIIPDFFRSLMKKKILYLRYPKAIRPWQHVIEPLYGYILLLMKIAKNKNKPTYGSWNFGPQRQNNIEVRKIISILNRNFGKMVKVKEIKNNKNFFKESKVLKLSSKKSNKTLGWISKYNISKSLKLISDWMVNYKLNKKNLLNLTQTQIKDYLNQS